jgi:hypothetical protein
MEEAVSALLGVPVCQLEPSSAFFNWCLWCIPAVLIVGPLWFTYWFPNYHRPAAHGPKP